MQQHPSEPGYNPDYEFAARVEIVVFNKSDPSREPLRRTIGVDYNAGKNFPGKNKLVQKVLRQAISSPKRVVVE
jgi:hypothetical protein